MRRFLVVFSLFFLFLLGSSFRAVPQIQAWDGPIIGTHLIQGDPGAQSKVIDKLQADGAGSGYPVVVMVDPDAAPTYAGLLEKISSAGFSPIFRINVKTGTQASAMATVASVVGKYPTAPVTVGNEIENPNEWASQDYSHYGALFDALAAALPATQPLGISTFNTSNANVDVATLIPRVLATISLKNRITAVFSNSYDLDCKYGPPERCTAAGTGAWVLSKINPSVGGKLIASKNLYITEFGTLRCKDYDCLQQFYEDHKNVDAAMVVGFSRAPGETDGTNWIHTAPTLCKYYKLGTLETIYPTKCGGGKNLYIYKGIDDQPDTAAKTAMATRYMMTCANNLKLAGKVGLTPEPNTPYRGANCPDDGSCVVTAVGTAYINHEATTIPLFRLEGALAPRSIKGRRADDLEGFLGAAGNELQKGADKLTQLTEPLTSGVKQKSLDVEAQCKQTINFLQTIKQLCIDEPAIAKPINPSPFATPTPKPGINKPGRCALDIAVPLYKTDTDKRQLYYSDVLAIADQVKSNRGASSICDLRLPGDPLQTDDTLAHAFDLLHRVETITPKAFKPAYIVRYVTNPKLDPTAESSLNRYSAWFPPAPSTPEQPSYKNRIIVTKIFVPANIATTGEEDGPSFASTMIQSLRPFVANDTINTINTKRTTVEYPVITSAMAGDDITLGANDLTPQNGSSIICPECSDTNSLETILAKRINADISFKKSITDVDQYYKNLFGDDPNLDCTQSDTVGETATSKKQSVNPQGNPDPVQEISIAGKALLRAKEDNGKENLEIRTYLLLPEEYRNIRDYEEQFISTLFRYNAAAKPDFIVKPNSEKKEVAYKFLQMGDTKPKANAGLTVHISSPTEKQKVGENLADVDPITGIQGKTDVNVEGSIVGADSIDSFNINPLLPGGKLARGLWEIVCHILPGYNPKKSYAKYEGFEKFLSKGTSACFTDKTEIPPTPGLCTPQPATLACANFRPGQEAHSLATFTPAGSDTETACSQTNNPGGSGQKASITTGIVGLAIQVGKATCVPAEMLIGTLAKESKGLATDTTSMSGDPKEMVIRNGCDYTSGDPSKMTVDCGAYQYTQGQLFDQIKDSTYGKDITVCLAAIGLASPSLDYKNVTPWQFDTRTVGVSMCVAAVNIWRGTQFTAHRDCTPTINTLESLPAQEVRNGVLVFHGYPNDNDKAWVNYLSFIDQYKFLVRKVRDEIRSCIK